MARKRFAEYLLSSSMLLAGCQSQGLAPCDLLFHVAATSNQITDVTPGMIDHVAICLGPDSVVEAIGRGVVTTPLDSVLQREAGYYIHACVRGVDRRQSLANARAYLGRAYDYLYLPDNDDIYCSELVQLAFVDRRGRPLFSPIPMSFHDATGRITDYWTQFYARRGLHVPEGQPGTNPGELSQRKQVKLKKKVGSAKKF
ncbi:MAG: hypothetical protein J6M25_05790 [Prevotella sp.]|nr:hypothetical protein [Prevotella sp.]